MEKIVSCAKLAGIDQEIEAMPMRYDTRVGDISESLSSGQKQRMLLARALYPEPKILLIDEATANLDRENEEKILDHICNLSITRICVTHKPETAAKADRIINLEAGKLAYAS
jgi:ATP-binding cassette subfamily B protein RaxB